MFIPGKSNELGTSRVNVLEAKIISQWIHENCDMLELAYNEPIQNILAVVTPYKSQANLIIEKLYQINKKYRNITVGTVHSLQGAERAVIILSTVLSPNDKLTFINNKYNMLNVATSRAKHSFLVFGNTNILNPKENNPLGNLKKWLIQNEYAELSNNMVFRDYSIYDEKVSRINTLEKHVKALRWAFDEAKKEIIIVSPFISIHAIESDNLSELIRKKVNAGVKVTVITDEHLDKTNGSLKTSSADGRKLLQTLGAELKTINRIHSKTIMVDDRILIEGSFNWLSAVRDPDSKYARHEISILLRNEEAQTKIIEAKKELNIVN